VTWGPWKGSVLYATYLARTCHYGCRISFPGRPLRSGLAWQLLRPTLPDDVVSIISLEIFVTYSTQKSTQIIARVNGKVATFMASKVRHKFYAQTWENWPKNGNYSFPWPKGQSEINAIAKLRSQDLSCCLKCKLRRIYRLSQQTNATKRLKLTFPILIGKCRRILVTVHDTTDANYTIIQCLQKRNRPVGEIIEEIQEEIIFITFISITIDSINERFPCTQRSAQKNFHAAIISRLATKNRTKLNIDDSDAASTHDVVLYVNSVA